MPELATLREADLYNHLPASSMKKGFTFLNAIFDPVRSGDTIKGIVLDRQRCQVEVEVTPTGLITACTCDAYGRGCKHCVALLLKWVRSPELFTEQVEAVTTLDNATPLRIIPVPPPPTHKPTELPAWLQKSWADRVQDDRQGLESMLNVLRLDDLRTLARNQGWTVKGTRKADVIGQMLDQLLKPEQLARLLAQLDREHRQAFWAIAILGAFPTLALEDMDRVAQFWGKLKQHSKFGTYLRHLTENGLVISQEQIGQYFYSIGAALVPAAFTRLLPPLLAEAMPGHQDLDAATATTASSKASGLQLADPDWLVRSVTQLLVILEQTTPALRPPMPRPYREKTAPYLQYWDYVPAEVYALEKQGKQQNVYQAITLTVPPPAYPLPDETMTALAPLVGDAERLEFLYHLMVAVGLLQPGSPVTVWPEVKDHFLRQSMATQQAILTRHAFHMANWSELWTLLRRDPDLKLVRNTQFYNSGYLPQNLQTELAVFRTLVLATYAWLPDNHWFAMTDLLALVRQVWSQFNQLFWQQRYYLVPGQTNRGLWHLTYKGQALDSKSDAEWQQAQGHFICTLLSGPLHWAGLVDLYHEDGKLTAVRFHSLGDLYWDRTESITRRVTASPVATPQPTGTTGDLLRITSNQIRVEPARITAQAHSLLDRIAVLEVAQPQQFIYRLDAATVQKSFEAGMTLTELQTGWETHLSKPIPAAIKKQITAWWATYGQLRLYQDVTIIEFGDDHALAEMKAVTSLNALLIAEISSRLVLIPKSAIATLAAELEKAGYTPQQTEMTE